MPDAEDRYREREAEIQRKKRVMKDLEQLQLQDQKGPGIKVEVNTAGQSD
ncbi:MAG: hypothetical protein OXE50_16425 [Chloroflexi bacterium]|nr:hypothetical protein [Chloroflexota bacterium]